MGGVTTTLNCADTLDTDLRHAVTLGFTGKLCVHPRQVTIVNDAFTPSPYLATWARSVLQAGQDGSATSHAGEMIDRPVLLRAEAILARVTGLG